MNKEKIKILREKYAGSFGGKKMTIRQAVVFAILMQHGDGILAKFPRYLREKLESCQQTNIPEQLLDGPGRALFHQYAKKFGFDWNSARDYNDIPQGQFDKVTGEAIIK